MTKIINVKSWRDVNLTIKIPRDFESIIYSLNYTKVKSIKQSSLKWVGICSNNKKSNFLKIYCGNIGKYINGDYLIYNKIKSHPNMLIYKKQKYIDNYLVLSFDNIEKQKYYSLNNFYNKKNKFHLTLTELDIFQIIKQLKSVYSFLWSNNIIHNDIHIGNIMYCCEKLKLKIIDFEISQLSSVNNMKWEIFCFLTLIIVIFTNHFKLNAIIQKECYKIWYNYAKYEYKHIHKVLKDGLDVCFHCCKTKKYLSFLYRDRSFFYKKLNSLLLI